MFERFGERARAVAVHAQKEARTLLHNYIGSEHLLLALSRDPRSVSSNVLNSFGITPETIRPQIVRIVGKGDEEHQGQIPFTPRSKKILELALREALALGEGYIGTDHILLGLVREDEGVASVIIKEFGVSSDQLREAVLAAKDSELGLSEKSESLAFIERKMTRKSSMVVEAPTDTAGEQPNGDTAGEIVEEPDTLPSEAPEAIESVPTHPDRPANADALGRRRLAGVLGERIRRARNEHTEEPVETAAQQRRKRADDSEAARKVGGFMVHVHAPWGAGKSSLLNFLGDDLRNRFREGDPGSLAEENPGRRRKILDFLFRPRKPANANLSQWIVVEFSAWQHQRLVAPWWWLLTEIQRSCARELWWISRRRWLWFWIRDLAWRVWNARAAVVSALILVGLVASAWASTWFGLPDESLEVVRAALLTGAAALALGGSIVGLVRGAGKWLAIGSAEGAVRFLRRAHDPLGVYRDRFRWLVRSSGRPITVFIDDLDRCKPTYVVELLEGVQTLFADEPVTYVVAADRSWVCESFASAYPEFEGAVGEPGRPLGFLFLEKTFQISLEIPPMSSDDRNRYWSRLMHANANGAERPAQTTGNDLGKSLASAATQAEVERAVEALVEKGADREDALQAGVRRLNAPDMQGQLQKLLDEFAPLLENNPRSMKRLMNAYGIERDRLLRDGYILTKAERRQLALLTILRMRWPLFADHLRVTPDDVAFCNGDLPAPEAHRYHGLFDNEELRRLFDGSHISERLDADLISEFPPRQASSPPR